MIAFVVPGQPQGKGRPRVGRVGDHARMFTPAKTVAYEGLIAHAGQAAMAGRPPLEGPVELRLFIAVAVPQSWSKRKQAMALNAEILPITKPDGDNVEKAICDGLNGVAWRDDAQVTDVIKRKRYSETPCVRVEIRPAMVFQPQREIA